MKEKKSGKGLKKTPSEPQVDLPPTHADFSFDDTPKRFKLLMKKIRHTPDGKTPHMIGQDNVQNTTRLSLEKQNRNQKNHFASSGEMELPKSHGTGTAPTSKSRSSLVKSNGRKNTVLKVSKESGLQKPKSSWKRKTTALVEKIHFGEVAQAPPLLTTVPKPQTKKLSPELSLIRERVKIQYQRSKLKKRT